MDDIAVRVENVSKDFKFSSARSNTLKSVFTGITHKKDKNEKTQHALKGVSFEIKKGEFFGIVGRNGSGKSTLLKIIAGIYQPNKGKVSVAGKLVPFIELGVGFNPELTGKENVYLNGAILGFSTNEIEGFYDEVVKFAELEKFMDKKLKNYSSGMQVRLAFSMAIRANADILLIDEVLAVGDADFQRKCFDYFKQLKKNKSTVVFVSHDMEAIREFCDRAVLIEESRVLDEGDVQKVAASYTRQFNNAGIKSYMDKEIDSGRWGDKDIIFSDIKLSQTSEQITITQTIKASKQTDPFVSGIRIKASDGSMITGTNTKLERIQLDEIKKGESRNLVWTFPNVLSDGTYFLDVALTHTDGIKVFDWWEDSVQFEVKNDRRIPYMIDPGFKVSLTNN